MRPHAVLFDLFHTLACVQPPALAGMPTVPDVLGVPAREWDRMYYGDDVLGRCLGHARDPVDIMGRIARSLDPAVSDERIRAAVENRSRRFRRALVEVEPAMLEALDLLRAHGIRTALVSDAGADDIEHWPDSPLRTRLDHVVFSCDVGVRKPSPEIYRHALRGVGASPADAVFVGDGGSDEHRGARAVGLRTVLVTRLVATWWPELVEGRRPHADEEFEDVPAFVSSLVP